MNNLLEMKHVAVNFAAYGGTVQAVRDISFSIEEGQTVALVGESGCGKSITAKTIMGLVKKPGKVMEGSQIIFEGTDIAKYSSKEWKKFRGKECSMIFQDALVSLNPTMKIGKQIMESLDNHAVTTSKEEKKKKVIDMLKLTGIADAEKCLEKYPHELSGGMRQRIMIAIALISHPKLLIADEPTTSLDVTIQAQILDIMRRLKGSSGSLMLITHNLGIVAEICEEVVVMYAGRAIERGTLKAIFDNPLHPYTQGLMASVPTMRSEKKPLYTIPGTVPTVYDFKEGCRFADRCQHCTEECRTKIPPVKRVGEDHIVQCWMNFEGEEPYHE